MLEDLLNQLDERLAETDAALAVAHGRPAAGRQPVHTVYVPADRFSAATPARWGTEALALLDQYGSQLGAAEAVLQRVRVKLATEPIEDLRIDFEDGYGYRSDDEEDKHAASVGAALAALLGRSGRPLVTGLRIKSMETRDRRRGVRTLDLLVGALVEELPEAIELPPLVPGRFVVTLPKVSTVAQVAAVLSVVELIEHKHRLTRGTIGVELQIELPSAIQGPDGVATVAGLVAEAGERCAGIHYGTYDYSAALGVAAGYQSLEHPVADHAKAVMLLAAAGAGVPAVDGSTNVVPAGSPSEVLAAFELHARLVRRSLERAYYQGWDMHPGHLLTRYLANYVFYREALPEAGRRLSAYLARTSDGGGVLDEPATARALSAVILRGLDCGGLSDAEVAAAALDVAQLRRLSRPRS
jgi:citrate lyase beta subunit